MEYFLDFPVHGMIQWTVHMNGMYVLHVLYTYCTLYMYVYSINYYITNIIAFSVLMELGDLFLEKRDMFRPKTIFLSLGCNTISAQMWLLTQISSLNLLQLQSLEVCVVAYCISAINDLCTF